MSLVLHSGATRFGRQDLLALNTPPPTETHVPIPHASLVEATLEALAYRKITVVRDEYGLTPDGMRMFGFLEVDIESNGVRLAIGIRNSHDKVFTLGMVVGYRTFVCDNLAFRGEFSALSRKHSKHINLVETVALGVDRAQRHFLPLQEEIAVWQNFQLPDGRAKEVIYRAFIQAELDVPRHLARIVHKNYFEPEHEDFQPRTLWSLSNAFTSAFKVLDPIPQMKAAAALGTYLDTVQ